MLSDITLNLIHLNNINTTNNPVIASMNNQIITQTDLEEMLGYKRAGDIARWLRDNKIKYFYKQGRIFTTIGLIEAAVGLFPSGKAEEYVTEQIL